jgi:hypothetical protein
MRPRAFNMNSEERNKPKCNGGGVKKMDDQNTGVKSRRRAQGLNFSLCI